MDPRPDFQLSRETLAALSPEPRLETWLETNETCWDLFLSVRLISHN